MSPLRTGGGWHAACGWQCTEAHLLLPFLLPTVTKITVKLGEYQLVGELISTWENFCEKQIHWEVDLNYWEGESAKGPPSSAIIVTSNSTNCAMKICANRNYLVYGSE